VYGIGPGAGSAVWGNTSANFQIIFQKTKSQNACIIKKHKNNLNFSILPTQHNIPAVEHAKHHCKIQRMSILFTNANTLRQPCPARNIPCLYS
ncbi:MAG: hypothetical protein K2F86_00795, partial [Duncaniella sp.]|nr:hypothetical protein [Duncaniella sp.]